MALQRTLRRMVSPANNMLLFCRAQSTGSAAIGILFPLVIYIFCERLLCNLYFSGSLRTATLIKETSILRTACLVPEKLELIQSLPL